MHRLLLLPLVCLLTQCTSQPGSSLGSLPPTSWGVPQIINVSAYDPKERQRAGQGYSEHDVSALRANGASGLIARAGKGGNLDEKCASFIASADRAGMLPGLYYRVQRHVDAVAQADQFVNRAMTLARGRSSNAPALLLCGDFDGDLSLSAILRFMDRVESRTGVVPVAYLENSTQLKQTLSRADAATKAKLRRMPYWLALYAHDSGAGPVYPAPGHPNGLLKQYDVWSDWTLWQYGGVDWERGRSRPKVYNHGRYRFPLYFGKLDRPTERNVFNGSQASLQSFWQRHGLRLR
ncbi:MAG: GH25 family lysozyme [Prosthecobacter sp.]|uniref:GH25 family lysozyme n=1 Tax=Prosthecobacter sp. TaxID=1965333 RepID=UPI0039027FEE